MMAKNNLEQILIERKLSYRQAAKLTGVSYTMIRLICLEESDPTQSVMIKIAKGLGLKVADVFVLDY